MKDQDKAKPQKGMLVTVWDAVMGALGLAFLLGFVSMAAIGVGGHTQLWVLIGIAVFSCVLLKVFGLRRGAIASFSLWFICGLLAFTATEVTPLMEGVATTADQPLPGSQPLKAKTDRVVQGLTGGMFR